MAGCADRRAPRPGTSRRRRSARGWRAVAAVRASVARQYYLTIPDGLTEAARIDRLNEYGIWARMVLPLSKPAPASLALTKPLR
ncbi:hypothetical protein ACN27F_05990 [Solwaraspora sp. WMMB335]|uniref:hypothetical protein n=1 Tax=Solwaraspora sp. WMMB335 TaxID=3404118 RepID=UPI003B95E7C9